MWKYLLICSVGVGLAFMGTLVVAASATSLNVSAFDALLWTTLRDNASSLDPKALQLGFIFIVVGYGTKAGLAPMHNWLPDAHSQAPGPVSALFSGFMLNAALYCVMRYIPLVEGACGNSRWGLDLLVGFGLLSILVAAAFILFQRDVKRLLAYHSVEHMGIITLGLGLGGLGTFAALFHTLNHSLCKTGAFF
jgi:hydrogenase-4 component F